MAWCQCWSQITRSNVSLSNAFIQGLRSEKILLYASCKFFISTLQWWFGASKAPLQLISEKFYHWRPMHSLESFFSSIQPRKKRSFYWTVGRRLFVIFGGCWALEPYEVQIKCFFHVVENYWTTWYIRGNREKYQNPGQNHFSWRNLKEVFLCLFCRYDHDHEVLLKNYPRELQ